MAQPQDTLVYDLPVPRRPGIDDLGGGAKENANNLPPPNPVTCPSAEEYNQMTKLLVAFAKVTPSARLSIACSSGPSAYSLLSFTCAGDNFDTSTFTVAKITTGFARITWPVDAFPSSAAQPQADINGTTPGEVSSVYVTNGVDVHIANDSGASADLPFSVCIW